MVQFLVNTFYKSLRTTSHQMAEGWECICIFEKRTHTHTQEPGGGRWETTPQESLKLYKSFSSFICNYCSVLIDINPPIIKRHCKSRQQALFQNLLPWFKVLKKKQKEVTLKTGRKIQPSIYITDNYQTVGNA